MLVIQTAEQKRVPGSIRMCQKGYYVLFDRAVLRDIDNENLSLC